MSGRLGFSSRLRSLLQQGKLDEARGLIRGFSPEVLKEEILRLPPRSGLALCSILLALIVYAMYRTCCDEVED